MAYECQGGMEIRMKGVSTNCLDDHRTEEVDLDHLKDEKTESLEPEICHNLSKSDVKVGICSTGPLPNYSRSFCDLPPALICEIFKFLDSKELGMASCVNTYLYPLASEHHLWKEFYYERWGPPLTSFNLGPGPPNGKAWKEHFLEREFRSKSFMGRFSIDTLYGHTEAIRTIFVLVSKRLVFTSGYDQVVRMWDMEEGLSIASSPPLGCTIRAVAADSRLLVAGGTNGILHGWNGNDGNPHLFDLKVQNENMGFRFLAHNGPVTCLALDSSKMYTGSWDTTIRVWDRSSLKCLKILVHDDWVWSLAPHDNTLGSTAGPGVYVWETNTGTRLAAINSAGEENVYSLARSHNGKLLFTGGEDGSIHMYEITRNYKCNIRRIATWIPHTGPINSLAFEFPWLVSASCDEKVSLIDVRKLLKTKGQSISRNKCLDQKNVEPPQRMLHWSGSKLSSIGIGLDRIVCGNEEGGVRIWNFSQALELEQRLQTLRGIRLEHRRRRKLQQEASAKGGHGEHCSVAAAKNQINRNKNGFYNKRRVSWKVKA